MKPYFIFLLLFSIGGTFASAQKTPVVKVYAYIQPVLPGTKKNVIVQENGKTIEAEAQKKVNYFFYVEQKKSATIKIAGIWMNGKKYLTRVDSIDITPIEFSSENSTNGSNKISLTPAAGNGNKILQLLPGAETTRGTKLPKGLRKMVQQSELVVIYLWNGKTWYLPVKKIKILSPAASV